MKILTPEVPVLFDTPLLTKQRSYLVPAGLLCQLRASFLDENGAVWQVPEGSNIRARFEEAVSGSSAADVDGLSVEPDNTILIEVPEGIRKSSGIYILSLGAFDGENLVNTTDYYIYVEPTAWEKSAGTGGVPRYAYLQQMLKDSSIFENELTQHRQFQLTDICAATIAAVQEYNHIEPVIGALWKDTTNFPDFHLLTIGISAMLFGIILEHYRKNSLPYNAAGIQINDNKINEYSAAYTAARTEYINKCRSIKVKINLRRGWRIIG